MNIDNEGNKGMLLNGCLSHQAFQQNHFWLNCDPISIPNNQKMVANSCDTFETMINFNKSLDYSNQLTNNNCPTPGSINRAKIDAIRRLNVLNKPQKTTMISNDNRDTLLPIGQNTDCCYRTMNIRKQSLGFDDGRSSISSQNSTPTRTNSKCSIATNGSAVFQDSSSSASSGNTTTDAAEYFFDERVQVDRKKLEQLITGIRDRSKHNHFYFNGDYDDKSSFSPTAAEEFFAQIMARTNTQITWPSRLKIGAKTKKDPYVKIFGRFCDVQVAKGQILSVLETRHTRVTLKIDVAYTDHSHIIGKHGRNTQQVMKETGCHIHFPDSNRNPELEKSNMVSVAGPLQSVEKARQAIRKLSPLVISLEMKAYTGSNVLEMNEDIFLQELSATYSLNITIRQNKSSGQPFATFKGSAYQEANIKQAVLRFQQHYLDTSATVCSTSLEILPSQQAFVVGNNGVNICVISQITGATIHHPKSDTIGATTFFIQGSLEAILNARRHLMGCLPISFMFEIGDNACTTVDLKEIEQQNEISINLRPKKPGETRQSIVIKAFEYQLSTVYTAKLRFSDDSTKDGKSSTVCLDYDFMQEFRNLNRLSSTTLYPSIFATPITISPLLVNTPLSITSPLFTGLPTPLFSDTSIGEVFTFPCITASSGTFPAAFPNTNETVPATSVSNFVATNNDKGTNGVFDTSNLKSPAKQQSPLTTTAITSNGIKANDAVRNDVAFSQAEPLAAGLLQAAKRIQESADGWKAPGAAISDYSRQKILATKAMQEKPSGARTPNDCWSGFGFSRSTPAETLRRNMLLNRLAATKEATILEKIGETCETRGRLFDENDSPFSTTASDDLGESKDVDDLLDEDEDKIGPWIVEKKTLPQNSRSVNNKKTLNTTSYFDFVNFTRNNDLSFSDVDDLATLLTNLQLPKYIDAFREQEIDIKTFLTMNDEDLKELGVNTFGARRKMLVAISEIRERRKTFG